LLGPRSQSPSKTTEENIVTFTDTELAYLASQPIGRLATVRSDRSPQVSPVGFTYNAELDAIDIAGYNMSASQKFRNVTRTGQAALVVDDVASVQPWRVRCVEIRGSADAIADPNPTAGHDRSVIRIHPRRIISFGVDQPDQEPHLLTPNNRDVGTDSPRP
jgi:pyridoxamine 5'-phosphate oxidase family protein